MDDIQKEACKLSGLARIREHLHITIKDLAFKSNVSVSHLVRLQQNNASCSIGSIRKLTQALCCTANDLIDEPSAVRLAQIKIAYLKRAFEEAKADAKKLEEELEAS